MGLSEQKSTHRTHLLCTVSTGHPGVKDSLLSRFGDNVQHHFMHFYATRGTTMRLKALSFGSFLSTLIPIFFCESYKLREIVV